MFLGCEIEAEEEPPQRTEEHAKGEMGCVDGIRRSSRWGIQPQKDTKAKLLLVFVTVLQSVCMMRTGSRLLHAEGKMAEFEIFFNHTRPSIY